MSCGGRYLSRCRENREICHFPRNIAKFGVYGLLQNNAKFAICREISRYFLFKYREIYLWNGMLLILLEECFISTKFPGDRCQSCPFNHETAAKFAILTSKLPTAKLPRNWPFCNFAVSRNLKKKNRDKIKYRPLNCHDLTPAGSPPITRFFGNILF